MAMSPRSAWLCALVTGATTLVSCSSGDAPPASTDDCVTGRFLTSIPVESRDYMDLLFAIDNSASMAEEQATLARELPRLIHVLTSGDRTGDGPTADDFEPIASLHVGILTSDMGTGGFTVPSCAASTLGDDGLLRSTGDLMSADCMVSYPSFLEYEPGISVQTPEQFGADFACVARVGNAGCSVEQPLEALLKALTPSTSPIVFAGGTRGHGDRENDGFLRADSALGLIVLSDEDDCSVRAGAEDFFDPASVTYSGAIDTRCHRYRSAQWELSRYVDGFRALRRGRESLLVFIAIAGVPADLIRSGTPDFVAILSDPRMQERAAVVPPPPSASDTVDLEPSCGVPGASLAYPPRRLVEVAQAFRENGAVQSICQSNYLDALNVFVTRGTGSCLWYQLPRNASGFVGCNMILTIPPPGTFDGLAVVCADLVGADPTPLRANADGSIECRMPQLSIASGAVPSGVGWYYDDFTMHNAQRCSPEGQHIAYTRNAVPPLGVSAALDCQLACVMDTDCPAALVCGTTSGAKFCVDALCTEGEPPP